MEKYLGDKKDLVTSQLEVVRGLKKDKEKSRMTIENKMLIAKQNYSLPFQEAVLKMFMGEIIPDPTTSLSENIIF